MQNNDKKYFIPVDGTPIEVSEEVYRAYYQPIWNTRYHAQKNGECRCTKAQLWKCDGVCPGCPFYAAGKKVSIDTPIGGEEDELTLGDTLADDAPSAESILMDKELLDALYDELNRLDPDGRRICELIMQGKTEREIAADIKDYALQAAISGKQWSGYKLVEGRSNRKYTDENAVIAAVTAAGYDPYEHKILGVTAMTSLLGKKQFNDILGGLITKPQRNRRNPVQKVSGTAPLGRQ